MPVKPFIFPTSFVFSGMKYDYPTLVLYGENLDYITDVSLVTSYGQEIPLSRNDWTHTTSPDSNLNMIGNRTYTSTPDTKSSNPILRQYGFTGTITVTIPLYIDTSYTGDIMSVILKATDRSINIDPNTNGPKTIILPQF